MAGVVVKVRKYDSKNIYVEDVSPGSKADFQLRHDGNRGEMSVIEMAGEEGFELAHALIQRLDEKQAAVIGNTIAKKFGYGFEKAKK